uniref:hypothetical protein n=1 Tax=Jeotgalibaca porci TaxID=1868793 RepID=UPI0035A0ED1C
MYTETETFYGTTETDLENNIHAFLDEPGFSFVGENRYVGEDGNYISEVKYTYTPSND